MRNFIPTIFKKKHLSLYYNIHFYSILYFERNYSNSFIKHPIIYHFHNKITEISD